MFALPCRRELIKPAAVAGSDRKLLQQLLQLFVFRPPCALDRNRHQIFNCFCAGGAVVPQFGYGAAGTDERALEDIYKAYNGERRVVGVKSREVRGDSF